ncbi:hypothetical protein LTS10_006816 [Elasticomyces elasticus]|nr:hypothetical protein LTS10_006816 [Elasticomyces elasticus]
MADHNQQAPAKSSQNIGRSKSVPDRAETTAHSSMIDRGRRPMSVEVQRQITEADVNSLIAEGRSEAKMGPRRTQEKKPVQPTRKESQAPKDARHQPRTSEQIRSRMSSGQALNSTKEVPESSESSHKGGSGTRQQERLARRAVKAESKLREANEELLQCRRDFKNSVKTEEKARVDLIIAEAYTTVHNNRLQEAQMAIPKLEAKLKSTRHEMRKPDHVLDVHGSPPSDRIRKRSMSPGEESSSDETDRKLVTSRVKRRRGSQ